MKNIFIAFVIGLLIACGGTYYLLKKRMDSQVTQINTTLGGYTRYTDYLTAGEIKLSEQSKFMAGTIVRDDVFSRDIDKKVLAILPSNATVIVSYSAKYAVGYNLSPKSYQLKASGGEIEVVLSQKPIVLLEPTILTKKHKITSYGWAINENAEVIKIYEEELSNRLSTESSKIVAQEEVIALCEKSLIAFIRDFLSKQPGVKFVPNIRISYTNEV